MRAQAQPERERARDGDGAAGHRVVRRGRVVGLAAVLLAGAWTASGCERQPARSASPARPAEKTPDGDGPGASRPGPEGPRVATRCVVPFPEDRCPPAVGFPAISADGRRVAVIDRGPDTGWGGLLITVRVVATGEAGKAGEANAAGGADAAVVAEWPVVTAEDHARFATDDQGAFVPAFARVLAARLAPVEAALAEGGFRPLIDLGAVHPGAPGEPAHGMQAAFEAGVLTVTEVQSGAVLWQRAIGPSKAWHPAGAEPERMCGPFPVGEVRVWVSREAPAAVARVTYVGSDLCPTELPYLILSR